MSLDFPELSEQGNLEAIALVDKFKARLKKCANETIDELYCDLLPHIETDAWTNYREKLRSSLQNKYQQKETMLSEDAWAKYVREAIYAQFKEELNVGIIKDLNERIIFLEKLLNERRYL